MELYLQLFDTQVLEKGGEREAGKGGRGGEAN